MTTIIQNIQIYHPHIKSIDLYLNLYQMYRCLSKIILFYRTYSIFIGNNRFFRNKRFLEACGVNFETFPTYDKQTLNK